MPLIEIEVMPPRSKIWLHSESIRSVEPCASAWNGNMLARVTLDTGKTYDSFYSPEEIAELVGYEPRWERKRGGRRK